MDVTSQPVNRAGGSAGRTITSLTIDGFWGRHRVAIPFNEKVNFLIGPNGSGKTTIVNLLAACLTVDVRTLAKLEFNAVRIDLSLDGEHTHLLVVRKDEHEDKPFSHITYEIYELARPVPEIFAIEFSGDEPLREPRYLARRRHPAAAHVLERLRQIVDVTWLSVHRGDLTGRERESIPVADSLVDIKLEEQSNRFVRYFLRLEQQSASLLQEYQRFVFLSLLETSDFEEGPWISEYDTPSEKSAILAIFEKFQIQRSKYVGRVDRHFQQLELVKGKFDEGGGVSWGEIATVVLQGKIHELVDEWNRLQQRSAELFRRRDTFVHLVNRMLLGKEIFISTSNDISFRTPDGRQLSPRVLSSGEKQLLIILGEALLQEERPAVYIADEPELSLHVLWQEQLVSNIRQINPNAQIIFATHSPDIVGGHVENVVNVPTVIE